MSQLLILNKMTVNKEYLKYAFIGGVAIGALVAVLLLTRGCRGNESTAERGPEETVAAFCKAVAVGRFAEAKAFCDTLTMNEYILKYSKAWEMLEKKDSASLAISAEILSRSEIEFTGTGKDGDRRHITYIISADEGMRKEKTATVRKVEGEWKVEAITDRN